MHACSIDMQLSSCLPLLLPSDPIIIQRLMSLLTGEGISDVMVSRGILALKEEWMR